MVGVPCVVPGVASWPPASGTAPKRITPRLLIVWTPPSRSQVDVHSTISQTAFCPRGPSLLVSSIKWSVLGQHGGPLVSFAFVSFCTLRC
eukprot:7386176-Prymnesium_polylepis.1